MDRARVSPCPTGKKERSSLRRIGGVARAAIRKRSARSKNRVVRSAMKVRPGFLPLGALRFLKRKCAARRIVRSCCSRMEILVGQVNAELRQRVDQEVLVAMQLEVRELRDVRPTVPAAGAQRAGLLVEA